MKKYLIYIGVLVVGVFLGWIIFSGGDKATSTDDTKHEHAEADSLEEIWTCSMHPQIRRNEPGACPICGMDLIPLDANATNPYLLEMSEEAMKISQIQTTKVVSENQQNSELELSGKIEVNETNSASLVTHIPGRIEKLYVSYTGEKVSKGQKIAAIYSPLLITAQKELLEAEKIKDSQPQLFEASKNKLKYWKITDKQIEEILSSKEVIETFNIYAAYSGVVKRKQVSVGDYLTEGKVLFDIQNLNTLWVVFDVYEKDIQQVKVGDVITFSTTSNPGIVYESRIAFIDPLIDAQSRTAKIRAEISNSSAKLKPEMFVSGHLQGSGNGSSDLVVPKSAVMWTGTRSVVYVQLENTEIPSFGYREVVLGASIGDNYVIKSGLFSGEFVVTQGAFVIDASAQLNNKASMMNQLISPAQTNEFAVPDFVDKSPKEFQNQLTLVINQYYLIKDALVLDEVKSAKNAATKLLSELKNVDMNLVKGDAHMFWMKKSEDIKKLTKTISSATTISAQRKSFGKLSKSIIDVKKAFGIKGESYEIYCPMANDKKGASWLSKAKVIKNPYFGDKMLSCGEITNTISPNKNNN